MPNLQKAREVLSRAIGLLKEVEHHLADDVEVPRPAVSEAKVVSLAAPAPADESLDSFESLRRAVNSSKWPEAVNPHLICNPESNADKAERGRGIIEMLVEDNLKGLKLLDYGCGEGYCAGISTEFDTAESVGYDVVRSAVWGSFQPRPSLLFTTDFAEAAARGPFDVVLLYDVIDHVVGEDAATVLSKAAGLLSPTGKIYMRTHPFTSRHATHLYHDLNKAYVHLVFSPDELKQLVPQSKYVVPSIEVTTPIMTYNTFIEKAGLKVVHKREVSEKVEPFFKIPKIADRIMKNLGKNNFPEFQMSLQFIDYVLAKK